MKQNLLVSFLLFILTNVWTIFDHDLSFNEKSRRAKGQFLTQGKQMLPPACYLAWKGTKNNLFLRNGL